MNRAWNLSSTEAGSNLKALRFVSCQIGDSWVHVAVPSSYLCSRDAEHRVGEFSLQLIEAWLSKTNRNVPDHAGHSTANAVVLVAETLDDFGHAVCRLGVGTSDRSKRVHSGAINGLKELQELWVGCCSGMLRCRRDEIFVAY